jgi:hypothetical protein
MIVILASTASIVNVKRILNKDDLASVDGRLDAFEKEIPSLLENLATGGIAGIHSAIPFPVCLIAMGKSEPTAAFRASSLIAKGAIDKFSSMDIARTGITLLFGGQTTFLVSHNQAACFQNPTNE